MGTRSREAEESASISPGGAVAGCAEELGRGRAPDQSRDGRAASVPVVQNVVMVGSQFSWLAPWRRWIVALHDSYSSRLIVGW